MARRFPVQTGALSAVLAALAIGVPAAQADATLTSCTASAFNTAVAAGGTVTFAVDCPDLVLTKTVSVGSGKILDLEGNGHAVVLDGGHALRLFSVGKGGQLTVRAMTLENGSVTGAN